MVSGKLHAQNPKRAPNYIHTFFQSGGVENKSFKYRVITYLDNFALKALCNFLLENSSYNIFLNDIYKIEANNCSL